jgi:predicted RNase H-like HicB family nuclease
MTYTVDLERDEAGWWVASVREVGGCRTQGRSIRQALERIREALAACGEDAATADLVPVSHLPQGARRVISRYESSRARLEREQAEMRVAADHAVAVLTREFHLSVRDAGTLLGLSHQRVHQIDQGG